MKVSLRIVSVTQDRRTSELKAKYALIEQARADDALLKLFNQRVRDNIARRDRVKPVLALLRTQAD